MIRLSRIGAIIRCATGIGLLTLGVFGCSQNGIGNGGLGGGTGTGGIGTGGTGTGGTNQSSGGSPGTGGTGGVAVSTCPTSVPANGASCSGTFECSYGSQTCCGVTYATEVAHCLNGKFNVGFLETPCQLGGCGNTGGAGGVGGAGGAAGGVGTTCPADPTPVGFSCFPDEVGGGHGCIYGSTTCCGVTYPTLLVTCQQGDAIVHQAVENPCSTSDYVCPTAGNGGGMGGAGGVAGAGGVGGAGGVAGAGGAGPSCPAHAPASGSACDASLQCTYGTVSCCGASYPTLLVICGPNGVEQQPLDNPCGGATQCGSGGTSGSSGAAGGRCCSG